MIVITDIGKDADDAIALTYAIIKGLPIQAVIVTCSQVEDSCKICKNLFDSLADRYPAATKIKIFKGSTKPAKGFPPFHDNIYQGSFSAGSYQAPDLDPDQLEKDNLVIIGPLTNAPELIAANTVKRALIQGQTLKQDDKLVVDLASYNLRCDPPASENVFKYQDKVPFGFITKTLAYQVPITFDDVDIFEGTNHPVGKFLADHMRQSFEKFKNSVPDLYERIYKGTNNIAYCYDPLTMVSASNPELFTFEKFGAHRIGTDIQADKAKNLLINTIFNGLK